MEFKFKNWWKRNDKGNIHLPLLAVGFNKESFWMAFMGFSFSVWKKDK